MSRWDSPLFTVLYEDDCPPYERIWDALVGKEGTAKVVRPNQATVLVSSQPSTGLIKAYISPVNVISYQLYLSHVEACHGRGLSL